MQRFSVLVFCAIALFYVSSSSFSKTDFERVCEIRNAAYHRAPIAVNSVLLPGPVMLKMSASELEKVFDDNRAGVICGGFAYYLAAKYKEAGYTAYILDSGIEGSFKTHVTVLVEIEHNGRKVLSVQDPTFNYALVDADGAPVDYNHLSASSIFLRFGDIGKTKMLATPADHPERTYYHGTNCRTADNGRVVCDCERTLDNYLQATGTSLNDFFLISYAMPITKTLISDRR